MSYEPSGAVRIAQIIHISDLHVAVPSVIGQWRPRSELRRLCLEAHEPTSIRPEANNAGDGGSEYSVDRLIEWTTGHQPEIMQSLLLSVKEYLQRQEWEDSDWSPDNARLAVTGDLSAIGDNESLDLAIDAIKRVAESSSIAPWVFHGNHDVWSGEPAAPLPMYFGAQSLRKRHEYVVNSIGLKLGGKANKGPFPRKLDTFFLTDLTPDKGADDGSRNLVFWAINTVTHEPLANSIALGEAEISIFGDTESQLAALRKEMRLQDINIVLSHHPVFDPFNGRSHDENPLGRMCLVDGENVCEALGPPKPGQQPLADVFLSGHVHKVFPEPTKLASWDRSESFLDAGQHQVIVGSACQDSFPTDSVLRKRPKLDRQDFDPACYWQALSFFCQRGTSGASPPSLTMRREVFVRRAGGDFVAAGAADHLTWDLTR